MTVGKELLSIQNGGIWDRRPIRCLIKRTELKRGREMDNGKTLIVRQGKRRRQQKNKNPKKTEKETSKRESNKVSRKRKANE